jgi:hypothetical protein
MRRTRQVLALAIGLAAVAGLIVLLLPPPPPGGPRTTSEATGIVVRSYSGEGDLAWEVTAQEGLLEGEEAQLLDPRVEFYQDADLRFRAVAKLLTVSPSDAELAGDVRAFREGDFELSTAALRWTSDTHVLTADQTTLTFDRGVMEGQRFAFDPAAERATLDGAVEGRLELDPEAILRCQRAEWNADGQLSLFDVEIEQGEMRYTATQAKTTLEADAVHLHGEARIALPWGTLTADSLEIDETRVLARGTVTATLDRGFFRGEDEEEEDA